jgi:hypothetical protein
VEELADQLQTRGSVDWQACAREHPEYVDQLRELLPALEALAGATAPQKTEDRKSKIQDRKEKQALSMSQGIPVEHPSLIIDPRS